MGNVRIPVTNKAIALRGIVAIADEIFGRLENHAATHRFRKRRQKYALIYEYLAYHTLPVDSSICVFYWKKPKALRLTIPVLFSVL